MAVSKTPRVAGVIVLYNSDINVLSNINSYINQIEKLFVVDNSDKVNDELITSLVAFPGIQYINNGKNEGIARALNKGASIAIEEGFDFLLTMDDDTSIPLNMVSDMLTFIKKYPQGSIGIIAPQSVPELVSDSYESVFFCITSGNLVDLKAFVKCGPFLDELFIDWVDHEFCIRLVKNNYLIIQLNYLYIHHTLGNKKDFVFAGFRINWISHSPVRLYYIIRNTLYVVNKHARFIPFKYYLIFLKDFFKEIIKNITLEDSRKERLKLVLKAIRDFSSNKMGPLMN